MKIEIDNDQAELILELIDDRAIHLKTKLENDNDKAWDEYSKLVDIEIKLKKELKVYK